MSQENHQENTAILEKKEKISKLTNANLAYVLGLYLNHKYDFGGYSVGRSERSFLLDLFFRLNYDDTGKSIQGLDPFDKGGLFLEEIEKRQKELALEGGKILSNTELDLNDKKIFSALVLRFWIKHYRESIIENKKEEHVSSSDFSFESEIKRAELLYKLYLSDLNIDENTLDDISEKFIDKNQKKSILKYTNEFRWHVDDLCESK